MLDLPSAIAVIESPDEVRYCLPQLPVGLIRILGLLPLAIGVLVASWPILGIVVFLSGPGPALQWIDVLLPLVLFGPICFPFGGYLLFKGLHIIAGHTEIALRASRLYVIDRCGPLRWTRRRPLYQLRGFRVEHNQLATLKADMANGKSVTVCRCYQREWVLQLAEELAVRCEQVARGRPTSAERIQLYEVYEVCTDHAVIQDRPRQPTNSTAILEPQSDGLMITIPPAGRRRGYRGNRRTLITVAGGSLQIEEIGLIGTLRHQSAATELIDVRARYERHEDSDGILWTIALEVEPKNGKTLRILQYRDKAELEWIATVVRQALRLRPLPT